MSLQEYKYNKIKLVSLAWLLLKNLDYKATFKLKIYWTDLNWILIHGNMFTVI